MVLVRARNEPSASASAFAGTWELAIEKKIVFYAADLVVFVFGIVRDSPLQAY